MERYPHELHKALTEAGYLGIAIPVEYGGSGLGIAAATVMMQTIAESGAGIAGAQSIHANVYPLQPVVKFASEEQKKEMVARLARRARSKLLWRYGAKHWSGYIATQNERGT